ncbi:MAG: putative glycoside hydrolase [Actinomycetota bacterium]
MARSRRGLGIDMPKPTVGVGGYRRPPRQRNPLALIVTILVIGALVGSAGWVFLRRANPDDRVPLVVLGVAGSDGQLRRLAGAVVTGPEGQTTTADEDGALTLSFTPPASLEVAAPGYETGVFRVTTVPPGGPIGLQLEPVVLAGRVADAEGNGISALVQAGGEEIATDDVGAFELVAALPGPIGATKPAWLPATKEWDGTPGIFEIVMEPFVARGVRVYGPTAGSTAGFTRLLEMVEDTTINTLVFDTKEETGAVLYNSQVADARDTGAVSNTYETEVVLAAAKERGYYTITRIVTFQDGFWAPANPEHAARNTETGGVWLNHRGLAWADPTDREAWEYPLALAVEACRLGFDEVQFDYVRFPSDGDLTVLGYDQPVDEELRVATISAFLAEAREQLHAEGCAVSADVFAIILSFPNDQGLGQRLEEASGSVDFLSPMIYPSHYSPGWLGFEDPNAHPSEVVGQALEAGMPRLQGAILRPWLQAFYYDAAQIAEEIAQAERYGLGWILWNATSQFEAGWFPTTE